MALKQIEPDSPPDSAWGRLKPGLIFSSGFLAIVLGLRALIQLTAYEWRQILG